MHTVTVTLSAATVLALLAAGCADLHWHKSGVAEGTLEEDLERCRQEARLQARRETLPLFTAPLVIGTDPQRRPIVVQSHQRDAERLVTEQDLTRNCMRGKGYELVRQIQ